MDLFQINKKKTKKIIISKKILCGYLTIKGYDARF